MRYNRGATLDIYARFEYLSLVDDWIDIRIDKLAKGRQRDARIGEKAKDFFGGLMCGFGGSGQ